MSSKRSVAVCAALAVGLTLVSCSDDDSSGDHTATVASSSETATASATFVPEPTPTPAVFEDAPSIDSGRTVAVTRDPALAGFIDAVEAEDIDQVLKFFTWNAVVCDDLIYRGVSECERRGVKDGTVLEFFAPEWWEGAGLTRGETLQAITHDLQGRHPRLALVVERSDGPTVLLFMIDPKPGLVFPGGTPDNGSSAIAIWFASTKDATGRIATYDHRYEGSPPMEFLRYEQYIGRFDFTILGVTAEFIAVEMEFHAKNEEQRRTPPAP